MASRKSGSSCDARASSAVATGRPASWLNSNSRVWIWARRSVDLQGLVHHSDRGGQQYVAIRYTERLADAGAVRSVGSRGDSYDNALAESVIGLYKTELVKKQGPWRSFEQLELATARWVDWYNNRRLHSAIEAMPPAEFEAAYDSNRQAAHVA